MVLCYFSLCVIETFLSFQTENIDLSLTTDSDPRIIKTSIPPILWICVILFIEQPLIYMDPRLPQINSWYLIGLISWLSNRDGSGSKILDPGLVRSIFDHRVRLANFFHPQVKKISSGRVKKYLGQRWVGPLFTASQKYAQVGSSPISTFKSLHLDLPDNILGVFFLLNSFFI